MPETDTDLTTLSRSRYAMLRTYRRDGTPVDTPMWFTLSGRTMLLRTKIGPKTRRLQAHSDVEVAICDHRGERVGTFRPGRARLLTGEAAERANTALHRRYGWQYNILPMVRIPGVTSVHRDLPLHEKLRRATHRTLWPDSAMVAIEL